MKYYFFLIKWRKSSEWKIWVTACALQSNSYLSIESAKRKIWKWWSAFRQETRKLGEVKGGSWQTCAMLIASVIAKMIALFLRMGRMGRGCCCCLSYTRKKKIFISPQQRQTVLLQGWFTLRRVNSSTKVHLKMSWDKQSQNLAGIKWAIQYLIYAHDISLGQGTALGFSAISNDNTVILWLCIWLMLVHFLAVK